MIQSRKFVAAAILMGLALIIAGLLIAPFNASARAAGQADTGVAADRIGEAFATLSEMRPHPALAVSMARVSKGDLGSVAACADAVWPSIDAACLATADGSPAPRVRTITIGYQAGENTTVLVRVPAAEMVQR